MLSVLCKSFGSACRLVGLIGIVGAAVLVAEARPDTGRLTEPTPVEKTFEAAQVALPGSRAEDRQTLRTASGRFLFAPVSLISGHNFSLFTAYPPSRTIFFRKLLI
jgi:hypothetical protein